MGAATVSKPVRTNTIRAALILNTGNIRKTCRRVIKGSSRPNTTTGTVGRIGTAGKMIGEITLCSGHGGGMRGGQGSIILRAGIVIRPDTLVDHPLCATGVTSECISGATLMGGTTTVESAGQVGPVHDGHGSPGCLGLDSPRSFSP